MLLNNKGLFFIVFACAVLSGCKTMEAFVQKVDDIKESMRAEKQTENKLDSKASSEKVVAKTANNIQATSVYTQTDREVDLTGSWVLQGGCVPRQVLFDLQKTGRNAYKGKAHIFTSLAIGYGRGSYQNISGTYDKKSGHISLTSENPKKYQNQTLKLKGAVSANQLIIDGSYLEGEPQGCTSFKAVKYNKSDKRKKPLLNLSSKASGSSLLGKLMASSAKPFTEKQCLDYFNIVAQYDTVNVLKVSGLNQRISGLLLDQKVFLDYFGTGYENWTQKDVHAYQALDRGCVSLIHQYPALRQKYRDYTQAKVGFAPLFTGNDSGRQKSLFGKQPNIIWAGNFYYIAVYRAAKLQSTTILDELASMQPTSAALEKIKQYSSNSGRRGYGYVFPLQALNADEITAIATKATEIYQQKYAVWLKNDKQKHYAALKQSLSGFAAADYPKTLAGIKDAKATLNSLAAKNPYHDQSPESRALLAEYMSLLHGHSMVIAQTAAGKIPDFKANYQGLLDFSRYEKNQKDTILPELLRQGDKNLLLSSLEKKWQSLLSAFDKQKEQEIVFEDNDLNKKMRKLDDYSRLIFKKPIEKLSANQNTSAEKNIAGFLVQISDSLRYPCDIDAAHPKDKSKPYYITGLSDNKLSGRLDAALESCLSGLENNPDNVRFTFQLGRVLFLSQVYDEARAYLEEAAENNYAPANYYLALMQMDDLGGFEGGIDKAISVFEKSADGGFSPAYQFVIDYRKNLVRIKKEEERSFRAQYKNPDLMKAFMKDEYVNPHLAYSIVMLQLVDLMKHMHGWCPELVSAAEVKSFKAQLQSPNASAYNAYVERYTNFFGDRFFDKALIESEKNSHPNDRYDKSKIDFDTSTDIYTLVMKHQCGGIETLNFVKNAKKYMNTAPPYNLASQPFWKACMRSTPALGIPKEKFCGCFLQRIRGGGITMKKAISAFFGANASARYFSHKGAKELLDDFWPVAQEAMREVNDLRSCKQ